MSTHLITMSPMSLTAGSATPITAIVSSIFASSVMFEAKSTNLGNIYWGASNATSTNAFTITPGSVASATFDMIYGVNGKMDLSSIYFAADSSGDVVKIQYINWDGG